MTHPKIAVAFNAPPRCGKDTLARLLPKWLSGPVRHDCFKRVLFEETYKRILPDFQEFVPPSYWGSPEYDETKDDQDLKLVMQDGFEGTARECLIHVSEDIIKPLHGKEFFGERLAEQLAPGYNLITDGGFEDELLPVIRAADVVWVVKLQRHGYTFSNDSRNYIDCGGTGALSINFLIGPGETPSESAGRLGRHFIDFELDAGVRYAAMREAIPAPYLETFA